MYRKTADHFASTGAIVLAGGAAPSIEPEFAGPTGTLLPRPFCSLGRGKRSLLQETLWRASPSIRPERTVVVVSRAQEALASRQLTESPDVLRFVQPMDRGTAAAILIPLLHLWWQDPESIVVVIPSDHAIARTDLFHEGIRMARIAVERAPSLIIVGGVEAEEPHGGYGWIVPRTAPDFLNGACLRRVERIVERPFAAEAEDLFRIAGLWSTSIVVAKATAILGLYRSRLPEAVDLIGNHDLRDESPASRARLTDRYERLCHADFFRELLPAAHHLTVLAWPIELGWTDLGTPQRLTRWLVERGELRPPAAEHRGLRGESLGEKSVASPN
jgi:mannose-1-phosphate guanylyltransferase